jgi:putative addiction module CopG family antidote
MARTTSFALGDEHNAFIAQQINQGAYDSASELVREAISVLADETRKEALWRASLEQGLASKRAKPGVFARVRKRLTAK